MNSSLDTIYNPDASESVHPPSSRWSRRLVASVPWLLLLGFALLAWILFGDQLTPAKSVEVESVVTIRQSAQSAVSSPAETQIADPYESPMLFQASGWIEPDPLPIKATALVNGVVESVAVLEGKAVKKDELLATLIREDFELDLDTARSDLEALQAQAQAHEASIRAIGAEIHTLHMKVKAGNMKCLELEDRRNRLERAGVGAVAGGDLMEARLKLQTHSSEIHALESSEQELFAEKARLEAIRLDFEAKVKRAETEVARRKLALDRTEVRSPVDGIVLRLLAVPGQKRMLNMDDPDSSTVAILYQPDFLQARIDVPLEEAAQLAVGQAVRLRSNFLSDRIFQGTVTRIVGEADLQRNTLQAKVRVNDPDIRLRPDMLCRAEFLASRAEGSTLGETGTVSDAANGGRIALYVPESALMNPEGKTAAVWAIDASGQRIERREIELGQEERDGHRLVREGLRPGDQLVVNPASDLEVGDRVRLEKEAKP